MKRKYDKKSFKTPYNYFEEFNDRLQEQLAAESKDLPGEDGFVAPDGYFDTLNEKITEGIAIEQETKVVNINSYKKYYYAAAAIAAIFLVVFGLQFFQATEITFDSLANADIEDYLDDTDLGLSSYEIAEVVSLDDIEEYDILENHLNEDNIMEYLDEHIDDLNELNLETDE